MYYEWKITTSCKLRALWPNVACRLRNEDHWPILYGGGQRPGIVVPDNNFSLNVSKTKELFMDLRKRRAKHAPIRIDRAVVEKVEILKLLGVHITKDL
jgi:hypothetical protein